MGENLEKIEKKIKLETTRTLPPKLNKVVSSASILIGIFEILFIFNFMFLLYSIFDKLGITIEFLKLDFQDQQVMAFVLAMIFIITFLRYPVMKKQKYLDKVMILDYILIIVGVVAALYKFWRWPTYMVYYDVNQTDVIFGVLAIILVLEATRRAIGWILPTIVAVFLLYGIRDAGFNWTRIIQYLYLDQGIFGIPFYVMTIYVFAFVFFGAFLLRIGVSDYITEFMISVFGTRPGGPAKAAVISSGMMGTVSGSSVANVLTTGTFTIPLMKKAGYPPEIAGAVEPVASTGGQLMPPVMGAAAFIMAQFLGVPYNKLIIAAVLPALIYYAGVYLFIDLETKRLGLKGMPREHFKPLSYFLKKIYILLPIVVITVALVWGIAPHIAAVSSLGIAIWVAWISKDEIPGHEHFYVALALLTTLLMFTSREIAKPVGAVLFILLAVLVGAALFTDKVEFNEKFYISFLFITMTILGKALYMRKEEILLMSGTFGIIFSLIVGYRSKTEGGKKMYSATYESMIDAGKTSTTVMLAAASAGLIQGVLTMTGLVTALGYKLVDLAGGNLLLLLIMAMIFSLILGMGVPTTANYVITSLVAAPAVYTAVAGNPIYDAPVPGYSTAIALLAAHFFVFYFGILADLTPPVALAAYAGSALAGGDFWKTAINSVKYALAGYIGPYIYFTHPEMFLITVQDWTPEVALRVFYYLLATILIMYMMAIAITGHFKSLKVPMVMRAVLVIVGLIAASLHIIPVGIELAFLLGLIFYEKKGGAS
ncbi:TRAP transporter fused permease subunit [Thermococcus sp. MAR1]|uniref:TRAP transporter permease n=1 Tax=Thermococcus sp. MAR1 TaxID=1638263 RepID=UPI001438F79B|nr:TRAP transporter fused permease subunit [Thermococcus sp. MAR1]NJE09864.1 TRAP transporter fused permease subunit [Thermococcus sp. MAR1]